MGWGYKDSEELLKTIDGIYRELEDYHRRIIALELKLEMVDRMQDRHDARLDWLEQNHG